MLRCLAVRNLAIIDHLELELGPGLSTLTGETGAGKSILVDALELVLGGRGRPELVRDGADRAEVEALFELDPGHPVRRRLEDAGFVLEDGELVVRRSLSAGGRSRAHVNGRLVTTGELAGLLEGLVDICSQHEHHALSNPGAHRDSVDGFGHHAHERAAMSSAYDRLSATARALAGLRASESSRSERTDLLRYQAQEIRAIGPAPGEDASLADERERLRHAEKLAHATGSAEDALSSRDGSILEELSRVRILVEEAVTVDRRLAPLAAQLEEARVLLEDAGRDLGRYAGEITHDPERLAAVDDRIEALTRLKRKYGGSLEAALEHCAAAEAELEDLEHRDEKLLELEAAHARAEEEARAAAQALTERRAKAGQKLAKGIGGALQRLGMPRAALRVEVRPLEPREGEETLDGRRLTAHGWDHVELLFAPNPGEPPKPLRKIASGGELSRVTLAIKRVLGALAPGGLYVFDEVDAGVGGAIGGAVGLNLRDIAAHHQVLCITHLPQVAVYATAHFRVEKRELEGRTITDVEPLGPKARCEEIARMLGGLRVTTKTRAAAAEMLRDAVAA